MPSPSKHRATRWLVSLTYAGYAVFASWLLLGPVGAFHWMVRFGLAGYLIVDLEDGPAQFRISWVALAFTLVAWFVALVVGWLPVRNIRKRLAERELYLAALEDELARSSARENAESDVIASGS